MRLQFADLVAAGLIPGDHDVEQVGVDGQVVDVLDGARGDLARHALVQRGARIAAAAFDHADGAAVFAELDHSADDPDGALVGIALLEERAAGGDLLDGDFLGERVQVFPLHSFERGQSAQQFYAHFTGIGRHASDANTAHAVTQAPPRSSDHPVSGVKRGPCARASSVRRATTASTPRLRA